MIMPRGPPYDLVKWCRQHVLFLHLSMCTLIMCNLQVTTARAMNGRSIVGKDLLGVRKYGLLLTAIFIGIQAEMCPSKQGEMG